MSHSQVWEKHSPVSAGRDFPISRKAEAQEQGTGLLGPTAHMTTEDLEPASARSQGVSCRTPLEPGWGGWGGREGWEAEPRAFLLRKPTLALKVLTACRKVRVPWVVGEEARVRCVTSPVSASVSPV